MFFFRKTWGMISVSAIVLNWVWAPHVAAGDLANALKLAYKNNPTLQAARAQLRATDEGVPEARADGLPSLGASVSETEYLKQDPIAGTDLPRMVAITGSLNVPIYSGGGVAHSVRGAMFRAEAGRGELRLAEGNLFARVVAAYLDVMRTEAILRLNDAQVKALEHNLVATSERFRLGELTRTDVAQSQSRLASAWGSLHSAEAGFISAKETYIEVIGEDPSALELPPPLPNMPKNVSEAVEMAINNNPDLSSKRQRVGAAKEDVSSSRSSLLPKVSFFADLTYKNYLNSFGYSGYFIDNLPQRFAMADVGVRATIPLYQGGRPGAQIRQAEARVDQSVGQSIATERSVIATTRSAWATWVSSQQVIASTQAAADAAKMSLEGVRAENTVGDRTILDILNAEQELVNSQIALENAKRNAYVAAFNLLVAIGGADAVDLDFDSDVYDVVKNYRKSKRSIFDWPGKRRSEEVVPKLSAVVGGEAELGLRGVKP